MISKKLKVFLSAVFALSLGMSVTSVALSAKDAEPVSALTFEGEEEDPALDPDSGDDPVDSGDDTPVEPGDDTPSEGGEGASEEGEPKEESSEEKAPASAGVPTVKEIFGVIKATFKAAWDDLVARIKSWFKRG